MIFQVFNLVCQSIESNYSKLINALPLKFFFSMVYKEIRNILYVNHLLVWWNGHLELSLRCVRKASGAIITMCFNKVLSREKKQVNRNLNNSKKTIIIDKKLGKSGYGLLSTLTSRIMIHLTNVSDAVPVISFQLLKN